MHFDGMKYEILNISLETFPILCNLNQIKIFNPYFQFVGYRKWEKKLKQCQKLDKFRILEFCKTNDLAYFKKTKRGEL